MVLSMVELPAEVETPIRVKGGERAAITMASMSSCPGSQSSHTFITRLYRGTSASLIAHIFGASRQEDV